MREIEEMISEMSDIKEIKKTLISWLKEEVHCGKDKFDVCSSGAVTDMIKDLAETSKECYESLYYKTVIEAMNEGEDEDVYGYNHRHMGNGQFAKSGRGHVVSGYKPYVDQEPYIDAYLHDPNKKGHTDGDMFDNYMKARRHYHDTKSPEAKDEMETHSMMYMQDTLRNLKAMWNDADPMLKKKMKEDFGEDIERVLERM